MNIPKVKTPKVDVNKIIQLSNSIYNKVNIDTITKELKDTSEYTGIKKDLSNLAKSTKKNLEEAVEDSGIEDASKEPDKEIHETMAEQQARFEKEKEDFLNASKKVIESESPKSISDLMTDTETQDIVSDLKKVNPFYMVGTDGAFTNNCSYAVVAYELRRRGYDVMADASYHVKNEPSRNAIDNYKFWHDGSESIPILERVFNAFSNDYNVYSSMPSAKGFFIANEEDCKKSAEYFIKDVKSQGEGARGFISVLWSSFEDSAHIINYEVYNGEVLLIDAQSGHIYSENDIESYMSSTRRFIYYRVDDKEIEDSTVLEAVVNGSSKEYERTIILFKDGIWDFVNEIWK